MKFHISIFQLKKVLSSISILVSSISSISNQESQAFALHLSVSPAELERKITFI
jgi:hypothetical protein